MLQQLQTIQSTIEPLQDAIMKIADVASTTTEEGTLAKLNTSLEEMRKAEKELRDRLFVLQVAKKYDWEAANKMARRKAGEYDDPDLAKVLEEREKKEEKDKRKIKDRATSSPYSKRGRFQNEGQSSYRGGHQGHHSHYATAHSQEPRTHSYGRHSGFNNYRQASRDEQACNNCHQKGHFWKNCPSKK